MEGRIDRLYAIDMLIENANTILQSRQFTFFNQR